MSEHLTSQEVTAWRSGVTDAAEILRLDDHLADCEACRSLVTEGLGDAIRALRVEFSQPHLTEAQLDDYAANRPLPADLMQHLDSCPACRADADDLRQFVEQASAPARKIAMTWVYPIAAMIALTALGLTAWLADRPRGYVITAVNIPPGIPAQYRSEVAAAIVSGTLQIPQAIFGLAATKIQLRSLDSANTSLHTLSPLATAVVSDTPLFRWTPIEGATYTVSVYDDQFKAVATGTALKTNEWHPDKSLERGAEYRWEVRATKGTHVDRAPGPTDPEARFTVLAADAAQKLTDAATAMPNEPMALGILYANAGAVEDARRTLTTAAESPAESPEDRSAAIRLLEQLK